MFVPKYRILMDFFATSAIDSKMRPTELLSVPRPVLDLMFRLLLEKAEFDPADYLRRNPDVAQAMSSGKVSSAKQHFVTKGYFEGRVGGYPMVDADWYLTANSDVASEVRRGRIRSAADHYFNAGADEWRSPSRQLTESVNEWRKLIANKQTGSGPRGIPALTKDPRLIPAAGQPNNSR